MLQNLRIYQIPASFLIDARVVVLITSPVKLLTLSLQNPDGSWKMTVDDCKLNLVVALIEASMTNVVSLLEQIQPQVHRMWLLFWHARSFLFLMRKKKDQEKFFFTYNIQ